MHPRVKSLYEMAFRDRFRESRGEAFQDFFSDIMERAYPDGDFVRVRPWGNLGDRKNDGYLRSERRLFACYGPTEASGAETVRKFRSDYMGALPYWKENFDAFTFVHNDPDGVGPHLAKAIEDINAKELGPTVVTWGRTALTEVFLRLSDHHLYSLFPNVPSLSDFTEVGLGIIIPLLNHLDQTTGVPNAPVQTVPENKIEYNDLSESARSLIQLGLAPASKIRRYYKKTTNRLQRDRIAEALKAEYESLRSAGHGPDEIFMRLKHRVCTAGNSSPSQEVASYGILAYFFEECDIFERPEEEAS